MINRQLYTLKFNSSRLKRYNYDISLTYAEAKKNGEIASLAESQMLRTIRKVILEKYPERKNTFTLDRIKLEEYYCELKKLKQSKNAKSNKNQINAVQENIIKMCYIPEYITIVMDHETHYDYLFHNGVKINGVIYRRLSTSAGQARVSTVVFCSEDIIDRVNEILDNGRNKDLKFSPSKFSAYKGVYSSATKVVPTPRFCVVPDFESDFEFDCNWVTETDFDDDDIIEQKKITRSFNRFDGQGLISPSFAKVWAEHLGLGYIPSEWRVAPSWIKGMLAVFDFHDFCEKENNKNYMVKSLYRNKDGSDIMIDLRNIDVILTESQFKMWKAYESLEDYKANCEKNELYWGVSLYTDEKLKEMLKMNYQFLQATNIKKDDIPKLCKDFVDWINNVNYDDIWSTLLFLIGIDIREKTINSYIKTSDNWWIKALISDHRLIQDKYIKQKIYRLMKTRIENGFIGNIYVKGNNQTLVSDPYAMMQAVCGHEKITGLLNEKEYYSNFWNERGVDKIVGMRPPLTSRAEVLKMQLANNEKQRYWYKYFYGGIIVNVHGAETDYWAGSDWDYDFLATSSNEILINSVYKNEFPVCYEAPKPNPIKFTDYDLYISDKFTFGSIIGGITNKDTSGHALISHIEEKYGKDSDHYKILENRIKMTCKLQSAQIDKAKIGREVKGIPKIWIDRQYIRNRYENDEKKQKIYEEIMLDRHPYFFIHLYTDTKNKYNKYIKEYDMSSYHKFGVSLEDLISKEIKTKDEIEYLDMFNKYMPVINNDCVMNNICRYLENVDWNVKKYIKKENCKNPYEWLLDKSSKFDNEVYSNILKEYEDFIRFMEHDKKSNNLTSKRKFDSISTSNMDRIYSIFKNKMEDVCPNTNELTNYLLKIFYVEKDSSNKDLLWNTYGNIIVKNILKNKEEKVLFPLRDDNGDIVYLGEKFKLKELDGWNIMKESTEK